MSCVWADGDSIELQNEIDAADQSLDLDRNYTFQHNTNGVVVDNISIDGHDFRIRTGSNNITVKGDVKLNNIRFEGKYIITGECNSLKITNCSFYDSWQADKFLSVTAGSILISNSTFLSGSTHYQEYFCVLNGGNITVRDCEFSSFNEGYTQFLTVDCDDFEISGTTFTNASSDSIGSALYLKGGAGVISDSTFIRNTANSAGAVYADGARLRIVRSLFRDNTGRSTGVLFMNGDDSHIEGCTFTGGDYTLDGAVTITGKSNSISDTAFTSCPDPLRVYGDYFSIINSNITGCDGTILLKGNNGLIKNANIINSAKIESDGINMIVDGSKFTCPDGDCLVINGNGGQVKNCEFNQFSLAVAVYGSNAKITNTNFYNGECAVYIKGGNGLIDGCIFKGCDSKNDVVTVHGANANIRNSKFQNNIAFYSVITIEGNRCTIDTCEFSSNTCKRQGAVNWAAKNGQVKNSVFKYNTGYKDCDGAISADLDVNVKITGTTFTKNTPEEIIFKVDSVYKIQYGSGTKYKIKVYKRNSGEPVVGVKFRIYYVVEMGKWETIKTNSRGIATTMDLSHFKQLGPAGSEGEVILPKGNYVISQTTVDLKDFGFLFYLAKGKGVVKAPKITAKHGKSKYFKIKLTHKVSKKPLKKFKIKLKVYTGKKYKTIMIKTNKKGIGKYNVRGLSRGSHKVIITSGNSWYSFKKVSKIKIK